MSFQNLVIEPILKSIATYSNRQAFCINNQFYSYKQFGEAITKIRKGIQSKADEQQYIGLVTNDDIETYASIFALWLEGKAYIPLHALQPADRSAEIIEQVNIKTILDSEGKAEFSEVATVHTSALQNAIGSLDNLSAFSDDTDIYILFTSGTTGKPKGVTITRKNMAAFTEAFWKTGISLDENDKCLQCFDLTFDVSVQSYLMPLLKGACVYTIPTHKIKYTYTYELLEDHQLTFGAMAPSMLRYLRPYFDEIRVPAMKTCILTAEASPADLVQEWHECIPNAAIYDFYGPTEGTIYCSYYKVDFEKGIKSYNGLLSIGKAMDGFLSVIIDEDKNIIAHGEKGELCIAGNQLTTGYWENETINNVAFFDLPYEGVSTRFYHTGDLCYFDEDGDIMYSGRIDLQAKIQGYRVELGEIEFHSRGFLNGINTVAIPFNGFSGNTEIALVIESENTDVAALESYLRSQLPSYMIPSKYKLIAEFPINNSGKVDRNKLKTAIV